MKHGLIDQEHGTVHYWKVGEKSECIVFTHGALMDHQLFKHQIDFFKKDFTVIAWDVPAHGQSRPYRQFSLKRAADELINVIDKEGFKSVHLVGQSMGGYIAQIVAYNYPGRVKSITTIGSSPIQARYYSKPDHWFLSITPTILRLYPYNRLIKDIAKQISIHEEGQAYALKSLKQYSKTEIIKVMKEVYIGIQDYLENKVLDVPIMITYGDNDKTGKVREYSNEWSKAEQIPLRVIPNAAHNANMDNPEFFNKTLKTHLGGGQV